jgi:Outer membrane protein beta-barrel domain
MKKVLLLLAVAVLVLQVSGFSQKSRVGFTAGITSANMNGKVDSATLDAKSLTGFTFGILVDAPIGKSHFSFQPGLHYVQKGRIISETNKVKTWLALRYIDAQMNFLYNSNKKTNFFIGLGPTVSFEMPSKMITRTSNVTANNANPDPKYSRSEKTINFGKEPLDDLRGLDYGINILTGFKMHCGLLVSLNYTFGLRNIANEASGDDLKNGVAGVRLGWLFNNK